MLSHTTWGGETETLFKILRVIITLKLNYGFMLYRTAPFSTLKCIDSVFNTGLRMSIGTFKSNPIKKVSPYIFLVFHLPI